MQVQMFSLLDRKVREFGQLILARNEEAFSRLLIDSVRGSGAMVEKYPGDFDVYCVGTFDTETGEVAHVAPRLVLCVADVLGPVGPSPQLPLLEEK